MAIYHLRATTGKPGTAAAHAAYIAREGKFSKGAKALDLVRTGSGNLPAFCNGDPMLFFQAGDRYERKNAAAYREYEVSFPNELTPDQCTKVLQGFVKRVVGNKPYLYAIHNPKGALAGEDHRHAHIIFSDRKPDGLERDPQQHFKRYNRAHPERGGCKKDSGGKAPSVHRAQFVQVRADWADEVNAGLERHGHAIRVDHRSHADRGLEREPERYLGPARIKQMTREDRQAFHLGRASSAPPA